MKMYFLKKAIKGQLFSKCPYEKSVSSKIPTKIFLEKVKNPRTRLEGEEKKVHWDKFPNRHSSNSI